MRAVMFTGRGPCIHGLFDEAGTVHSGYLYKLYVMECRDLSGSSCSQKNKNKMWIIGKFRGVWVTRPRLVIQNVLIFIVRVRSTTRG